LVAKKKNEKRVLCVGDSFTEGVGAPADSCYVSILRTLLDSNYTVMNAGISGDDPCVNYVNYRDRLTSFKPDIIVQTLSSNDLNTDIATKGGMERFKADGIVQLASAPWWEPLFAISYVSRTFFHALGYNELLLRVPFSKSIADELNQKAIVTFAAYAALAQKHNTLLLVILQPNQGEVYKGKFDYDIYPIAEKLKEFSNVRVYDLRTFYMQWFSKNMDAIKPCYWPQDGHHNAKGYAVMATGIKQAMDSLFFNINKQ
jgi:lysophospholipase L1-like esterase